VSLDTIVQVSWPLTDTLGWAAFSPERQWGYEDLTAFLPNVERSWLGASADAARERIDELLAAAPL